MRTLARVVTIATLCLALCGCIVSSGKLFDPSMGAKPLPQDFVVHFKSEKDVSASRVTLDGDVYKLQDGESTMLVRFFAIEAKGVRSGMYVVEMADKGDAYQYALAEIGGNELTAYGFDAGPRATALKVPAEIGDYATSFASAGDLFKVMEAVASSLPEKAGAVIEDRLGKIRVTSMEIFDFADPARKANGEKIVAQAEAAKKQADE